MASALAQTPLYDWHAAHGARLVDFAGWSMPVQYTSIVEEHQATRRAAGLFDVSHMGRLHFSGPDAGRFVDHLVTRRVSDLKPGRIRYALVCNEAGGVLDDVLVYRLPDTHPAGSDEGLLDGTEWRMVVNAGNRAKIVAWIREHLDGFDTELVDRTEATAMIAVQGPAAVKLMQSLLDVDLAGMRYYRGQLATVAGETGLVSRTGYTGENGCELIVAADAATAVWTSILAAGADTGARAAGLGARDTLRLEAAMPLYGHELTEQINPLQAGLEFACTLEGREFIGRDALLRAAGDPQQPRRIGLTLAGRRVPREGYPVLAGGERVGEVTSGTFSPTLERPIAMAYVRPEAADAGDLAVDIRGRAEAATVTPLPFYTRPA